VAGFGSYGVVLTGVIALAIAVAAGSPRALVPLGVGGLAVVLAFAAAGFWWLDGLFTTVERVHAGAASHDRPLAYFLVANLAAAAIAVGPAAVGGLACLRGRRLAVLPLAGLAAILLADVSVLSRGEVERIWLPFYPWVAVACAALPALTHRRWLAVQAGIALAVQCFVLTGW
jgi:hypothetical protein